MFRNVMVLIMLASTVGSVAWAEGGDGELTCADVQQLTASIEELASALKASMSVQQQQQNVLIAIQYLQFRNRNIEGLEAEVRRLDDRRSGSQERIDRMTADIRSMERRQEIEDGDKADELAGAIDRYSRMVETEKDRMDRYERQIIDLENRILDTRRQLMDLEEFITENLDTGP